jgi:hypothetical protein
MMTTTTTITPKAASKRSCFVLVVAFSLFLLVQSQGQLNDDNKTSPPPPVVLEPECIAVFTDHSSYSEDAIVQVELNNCAPLADNDWIGIYQEENVIVVDDSNLTTTKNNNNAMRTMLVGEPVRWFWACDSNQECRKSSTTTVFYLQFEPREMPTDPTSRDASDITITTTTTTAQSVARRAAEASTSPPLVFEPFLAAGRYKIIVARDNGEPSPYVVLAESQVFQILSTTGQSCCEEYEAKERLRRLNLPLVRPSSNFEQNLLSIH